jgi:hypothetical protein
MKTAWIVGLMATTAMAVDYPIVDIGQIRCDDGRAAIFFPNIGKSRK